MKRILGVGVAVALTAAVVPAQARAARPTAPAIPSQSTPAAIGTTGATPRASVAKAAAALRDDLVPQGVVSIDAMTGAPRVVARLDGFLTDPSTAAADKVARTYLASHTELFATTGAAVAGLEQTRDYVDIAGTHHLSFAPRIDGVPVFGAGVTVNVSATGQIVNVVGSPGNLTTGLAAATPKLSAAQAVTKALRDGGSSRTVAEAPPSLAGPARATQFAGPTPDAASLTWFDTGHGLRLAWRTVAQVDSRHVYQSIVDAASGAVLSKTNTVVSAGVGSHWYYLPSYSPGFPLNHGGLSGPNGSQPAQESFVGRGWIAPGATTLNGNNAHSYSDPYDDDLAQPGDEISANGQGDFIFPFHPSGNCGASTPCSWNPGAPNSWQTNLKQNATQVFWYVNEFHDHLAAAPIGFTAAAGNFQADGGDAVQTEVFDGAATAQGLPDDNHRNNANMSTGPDGTAPRMQMYLFDGSSFLDSNGGDDASIIYHEYTHGLSHRLVLDPNGLPALDGGQANAMGEAWSDWYAMDYLIKDCTTDSPARPDCWDADEAPNTPGNADVWLGQGVTGGKSDALRSQPLDCLVGDTSQTDVCTGGWSPHSGGYTYADFGHLARDRDGDDVPEVHADGEIWAETLWQLRQAIGPANYLVTEDLVTRAMELSPTQPSFLDERDAILIADTLRYGGAHRAQIWSVFAQRGMGWSAQTTSSQDPAPKASFDLPPTATGALSGTVLDSSGAPVAGANVAVTGHVQLQTGTDANGNYAIPGVPVGSYSVTVSGAGYEPGTGSASVNAPAPTVLLTRDWAALSGGASLVGVSDPDLSRLCPGAEPAGALDLDRKTGWLSTTGASDYGPGGPKSMVVALPRAIDVSSFAIDPTAPCGATPGASLGSFSIETSPDGASWTPAFGGSIQGNGVLGQVPATAGSAGVRYVRLTMLGSQAADGDGSLFMGVAEFSVRGVPSPPPAPPAPAPAEPAPAAPAPAAPAPADPGPPQPSPTTAPPATTPVDLPAKPTVRKDTLAPRVTQTVKSGQTLKTLLRSGLRLTVTCNEACRVTEKITIPAKTARSLGLGRTAIVVGTGTLSLRAKGRGLLVVKLTPLGRRVMTKTKKVSLGVTRTATDRTGNSKRMLLMVKFARKA